MGDTDFTGQRVLVVGGSSGIGNGIAHAFKARGATVCVWGTRATREDYAGLEGSDLSGLAYAGVQFYCGSHQHIPVLAERRTAMGERADYLRRVIDALTGAGGAPAIITGGGTGTHRIDATLGVFTELQVGSYVFMDRQYLDCEFGLDDPYETALMVDSRVVSSNSPGLVTLDAGLKSFATEAGPPVVLAGSASWVSPLGRLRAALPSVPFIALTATAPPRVRDDIVASLGLAVGPEGGDPSITRRFVLSFNRPNLHLSVSKRPPGPPRDAFAALLEERRATGRLDPTIIYTISRSDTERVAADLAAAGLGNEVAAYHAGLDDRGDVHRRFMRDEVSVVVATVAFGMGIDKHNIRRVYHHGAPAT